MNETQEQLEKSIKLANYRLQQLKKNQLVSDEVNTVFNKLLIKKAVMSKQLQTMKENKFQNFVAKFIRKAKGQTLICDRF